MDVFFETQSGAEFSIELGYWDTVLEIKKKIEKYQRIPVPIQTLFFQGKVLQDDFDIEKCNILHNSRVLVYVDHYSKPNHNSDQVLPTEQSLVQSNSIGDLIYGEDLPLTTEIILKIRPFYPVPDDITDVQDSPVRNNDQSPAINGHQDSTVTSQDVQTEQSPPSNSVKENITIQDSSVEVRNNIKKIVVILSVLSYSGESEYVKSSTFITPTTDQVKILRNKLLKSQQMGQINLPQDGKYFFVHKGRILNEDQSFEWNGVAHTDRIKIIPDPWLC